MVEALAGAFYSGGGGIAGAAALLRELGVLPAAPRVRAAPRPAAAGRAAAPGFGACGAQDAVEGTAPRCGFRGRMLPPWLPVSQPPGVIWLACAARW